MVINTMEKNQKGPGKWVRGKEKMVALQCSQGIQGRLEGDFWVDWSEWAIWLHGLGSVPTRVGGNTEAQ